MAETTVKQPAFSFIAFHIQSIGLSCFVNVGAIFSAVTTWRGFHLTVIAYRRSWHLHLRLVPRSFSSHATECSRIVGEGTIVYRFKSANFSDCGPISACATDTRIQPEYPVLFSMLSGEFCLRSKPYFVVKIASNVLTEHCCQVFVRAMLFCRSDCPLCAGMCGKRLRNLSGNSAYHVFWPVDTPTGQNGKWKIFFTFDFHILP